MILALHDMTHNSRVFKQADALHVAGFDVTLIGIMTRSSQPLHEEHEFGRVVRVRTTKDLHAERELTVAMSSGQPERQSAVLLGIRMFMGRLRENHLLARAAVKAKPDVVIASDLTAWIAGYIVKRRVRTPLVLDVRDLALDSGRPYPGLFVSLYRRVEAFMVRRADAMTTVSPLFAEVFHARYPSAPCLVPIYSGAFECVDEPQPVHHPLRLFFQGNFAPNRRLDELIIGVAGLDDIEVTLALQGFGVEEARLRRLVSELKAEDRIEFIPPCDVRRVVRCASDHDVGVINYRGDTLNLQMTVPIKLLDYMAAGLAVLASDLPGIRHIVEAEGCGMLFEPTGSDAVAAAIRSLASDRDAIEMMKANSVAACARYAAGRQGKSFVEVVESVMGDESRGV
ncbi:glycosyltransferase family 4 protein [Anaerosoma tenue]|uniref:glycosyltransferase family 4 protein n=1 Tax=Anaerosoma tenue TaxID=2933588 RepID=UPI002260E4FF|nr:glycosyltransferase family 4 protein [Anaerosoma tenue]MCK8114690.1 glycosyltransferase family 4 protein [Anaerosoma tenue]